MSQSRRTKRPVEPEAPAALQRFEKLTKALLGVSKDEYDQERAKYDRQSDRNGSTRSPSNGGAMRSARMKLDRARDHLQELEREDARFFEQHPYGVVCENDQEDGSQICRLEITADPPERFGLIAGDCLHNLRSSLDHLAWALASLATDPPYSHTHFPTLETESKWMELEKRGDLHDLPRDAVKIIRSFQPYMNPVGTGQLVNPAIGGQWVFGGPEAHPLWILSRLDNGDKHRAVSLLIGTMRGIRIADVPKGLRVQMFPFRHEHGTVLLHISDPKRLYPDSQIHLDSEITLGLVFGQGDAFGCPLFDFLNDMEQFIRRQVFPAFDGFFC